MGTIAKLGELPADMTPHTLRHSFASLAGDLGYCEPTIAALVGHKGHSITSRYIHAADAVLLAAADAVADRTAKLMGDSQAGGMVIEMPKRDFGLKRYGAYAQSYAGRYADGRQKDFDFTNTLYGGSLGAADRAHLKRWIEDVSVEDPIWDKIVARVRGGDYGTIILYALEARRIAEDARDGHDPILEEGKKRRADLLALADKADDLARYYQEAAKYSGIANFFHRFLDVSGCARAGGGSAR